MLYCGVIYIRNYFHHGATLYFESHITHAREYSRLLHGIYTRQP